MNSLREPEISNQTTLSGGKPGGKWAGQQLSDSLCQKDRTFYESFFLTRVFEFDRFALLVYGAEPLHCWLVAGCSLSSSTPSAFFLLSTDIITGIDLERSDLMEL